MLSLLTTCATPATSKPTLPLLLPCMEPMSVILFFLGSQVPWQFSTTTRLSEWSGKFYHFYCDFTCSPFSFQDYSYFCFLGGIPRTSLLTRQHLSFLKICQDWSTTFLHLLGLSSNGSVQQGKYGCSLQSCQSSSLCSLIYLMELVVSPQNMGVGSIVCFSRRPF